MENLARRFGRLIALHRKTKGWTQEQLAQQADISQDMIAKMETGVTGARFPTITKLANALEVDPSELFFSQVPRGTLYRGKRSEIVKLLEELPDKEVEWAYDLFNVALRIMQSRPARSRSTRSRRNKTN